MQRLLVVADRRSRSESLRTNHLGQPIGAELKNWKPPVALSTAVLRGKYVRLERLHRKHVADLYVMFSDDQDACGWTYLPYGPFASEQALADWADAFTESADPFMYALVDIRRDKACGVASYLRINPAAGSAEVGHIHFSNKLKKSRAATEAMYLMAQHVFRLGYRRYEWKCDALNGNSRRAALRFGFTFEGVFRQATVYKNRNRDTAWFALLDIDWPVVRDAYDRWLADDNFDENGQQLRSLTELISATQA